MGGAKSLSPKYNLMAEIKGTNVASKIVPYTDSDEYATHDEKYGVGGYRTVDSVSEMNAIPAARRKEGMLVYVKNDRYYRLNSSNTFVDAGIINGASSGSSNIKVLTTSSLFERNRNNVITLNASDTTIIKSLFNNQYKNVQLYYLGANSIYPVNVYSASFSSTSPSTGNMVFLSTTSQKGVPNAEVITYSNSTNTFKTGSNSQISNEIVVDNYNLSQNGYVKFQTGLMIQWGRVGGSSTTSYSVTMPTSFYNTEYKIFATVYKPRSDSAIYSASPIATDKTVSRFYLNRNYASGGATGLSQESWDWFAIGRWK